MRAMLCLGEALVDLIAQSPGDSLDDASAFTPHFGGASANVAVLAARAGARVSIAGGAGEDRWGRWLRSRLRSEGVGDGRFVLLGGVPTQLAFVSLDGAGEPRYELHGIAYDTLAAALGEDVEAAIEDASAVFIGSNTLAAAGGRAATMRAREHALARGRPVVLDCNLRLHRWSSPAEALAAVSACVSGALLVRANASEAAVLTGEDDPARAADALLEAGAASVVLTLGSGGTLLRGTDGARGEWTAPRVTVRSTVGAGDAITGTLLAALQRGGYDPAVLPGAMDDAVAAAAAACERWGALD